MSKETLEWLNQNTLIGFTEKRGHAWHYREGSDNHFEGPVPIDVVEKRLFDWEPIVVPVFTPKIILVNGRHVPSTTEFVEDPSRISVVRSDNGLRMGYFTPGYRPHEYRQWLLENVSTLLDDDLFIGSAGLLRGGAVAWVSVEVPETMEFREGIKARPFIIATTSFDGSLATTYGAAFTNVVCDNTLNAGMSEMGDLKQKIRHRKNSLDKIQSVRDKLGLMYQMTEDFQRELDELLSVRVTDDQFREIVKEASKPSAPKGKAPSKRGLSLAATKTSKLLSMWSNDERVAPWRGTAYGAWQALNTYRHHESIVRNATRPERNMINTVDGTAEKADAAELSMILELAHA